VWNYKENTLENNKFFEEEAFSISFHPSGYYIIVCFAESIVLMNIFETDLVPFKEIFVRNCKDVKFSNGGHLFALNNLSMVQVY
jgi:hypothetical protein